MFDFSHLPQNAVVSEYVFNASENTASVRPRSWYKPPNTRLVFMLLIGGGGGGAGGAAGISGGTRNGGGGGGSGGISQALFLSWSLPNVLYIYAHGNGTVRTGAGGASSSSGVGGTHVAISNYPGSNTSVPSSLTQYLEALGGNGGSTTSAGAGAGASFNSTLVNHSVYYASIAGRAGTWVANGLPPNTSIGNSSPILGGAGGGGVLSGVPTVYNGAGFSTDITSNLRSISGGIAGSGQNASSGLRLPYITIGGCGGGATNNGPGGRGGNGVGYGAGGGGGGAGVTGNGGRGGDGGPAYACIIAW